MEETLQISFDFDGQPILIKQGYSAFAPRRLEVDLYEPVVRALGDWWAPREELSDYILEIVANQGRRATGGLWTRPDIVCVGACAFPYLPGRTLELTTFEIKKSIAEGVAGLFEAAAHSVFSHRSFLVLQGSTPANMEHDQDFVRVESECKRFGLGLMVFFEPNDWRTFEIVVEPRFNQPAPSQINRFIATQLSEHSRQRLLRMFR